MIRSYREMLLLKTFKQRFEYLKLGDSFRFDSKRFLNQKLYKSPEWKEIKRRVIIRDGGNDLACEDYPISGRVVIHHINPITYKDIIERDYKIFDMDNLVTCSLDTHNAIHTAIDELLQSEWKPRTPNDTSPWLL